MIEIVGINYKSAPITIREQFVINKEDIKTFLTFLKAQAGINNSVVLSTCNRTEIYFTRHKDCNHYIYNSLIRLICKFKNLNTDISSHFYTYSNIEAVRHLFNVASGLDSMVLGENQVQGQIKEAYSISVSANFTDSILNRIFHKAFEAGKRVRTETSINEGSSSVSYAAVKLATSLFQDISSQNVFLIGAGETGKLVLQSLVKRGCHRISITNRTYNRAETLAKNYKATPIMFDRLEETLIQSDIIIASSISIEPIIRHSQIHEVMKKRDNKSIFLIDLSVPRVIEREVKEIENVHLYNIDDLEKIVSDNYNKRQGEINKANKIVNSIVEEYVSWFQSLNLNPIIELLTEKFGSITKKELNNLKNKITESEYEKVNKFSDFLTSKYLGLIIKNLKNLAKNGKRIEYLDLVNKLFDLHGDKINKDNE